MSSSYINEIDRPATIPQNAFLGCLWGGVAITFCLVTIRFYVRLKVFHTFSMDDAWVLLSWLAFLITAIVWQGHYRSLYLTLAPTQSSPLPPDLLNHIGTFARANGASSICFFAGIWSVKFAFLASFRELVKTVEPQKTVWWCILVATICGYLFSFGLIDYKCAFMPIPEIIAHCFTPSAVRFRRTSLWMAAGIDVTTDILISLLPISLLWKVRINLRQKLALGGTFSLTAFIVTVAIIRAVVVSPNSEQFIMAWIWMWSGIEHAVALIVVCLVSYRAYFTNRASRQQPPKALS